MNSEKFMVNMTADSIKLNQIEVCSQKVNSFYGVEYSYPVTYAYSAFDVLKHGLLPWAKTGLRDTIILRNHGISNEQITHEMAHFALRKLTARNNLPIWFDEGMACYLSNMNFNSDRQKLKMALHSTGLPNICNWKGKPGKLQWLYQMYICKNLELIYGQSYFMIIYLLDQYSKTKLLEFISILAGSDFDDAFCRIFGVSVETFYRNFLSSLDYTA